MGYPWARGLSLLRFLFSRARARPFASDNWLSCVESNLSCERSSGAHVRCLNRAELPPCEYAAAYQRRRRIRWFGVIIKDFSCCIRLIRFVVSCRRCRQPLRECRKVQAQRISMFRALVFFLFFLIFVFLSVSAHGCHLHIQFFFFLLYPLLTQKTFIKRQSISDGKVWAKHSRSAV